MSSDGDRAAVLDFTPSMTFALASIGRHPVSATDLGVGGTTLRRLWELGFLQIDTPATSHLPPLYTLTPKGEGAAAILTSAHTPREYEGPVARIQRIVADHFNIPVGEMTSARRSKKVARPRQVAMYLTKKLTPYSLPTIGRYFGGRDHTTIIHGVATIERLIGEDVVLKHDVKTLMSELVSTDPSSYVDKSHKVSFPLESASA